MLKFSLGFFLAGWAVLVLITITGNLVWDNRLLWVPPILFSLSAFLGLVAGTENEKVRIMAFLIAALSFFCACGYIVFYFFLFGLVGH